MSAPEDTLPALPWSIWTVSCTETRWVVRSACGIDIASFSNRAAARLFLAAPDLQVAARRALNVFKAQGESVRSGSVLGALDAALAKAEVSQ